MISQSNGGWRIRLRDIPIPRNFLEELKVWKDLHSKQNLIVHKAIRRSNGKLLKMVKWLARRAGI
jgi:hypothetical protein